MLATPHALSLQTSMQVTRESRRAWWVAMLGTWVVCGALILLHTRVVREYVALLDAQGLHGAEAASTPLRQVIPARFADAQMWVRHALAAREAGDARVRFTQADNAPAGREVHWSSAFGWLVRGAGSLQRALTGQPLPLAQERALLWFNAPLLLAVIVLFSTWIGRRAGAGAGVIVALALVGHARFYEAFGPGYVDHHGLVDAAVFGLVVGAVFMGAGWWKPAADGAFAMLAPSRDAARRAAIFSAVCGALGMWMSAAVVLPVIALLGVAGVVIAWWQGREAIGRGVNFDPGLWRTWGRSGAIASFVCYLLEYAPAHLGLRLEANHPLYSLAWWGGAEIVAILAAARVEGGRRPPGAVEARASSQTRPEVAFHLKPTESIRSSTVRLTVHAS